MDTKARDTDEEMTLQRAAMLGMRYFDTRALTAWPLFPDLLSNEAMYHHQAVVIDAGEGHMIIAITTKTPQSSLKEFRDKFRDYNLTFVMISESGFKEFMTRYDPVVEANYEDIKITAKDDEQAIFDISKTLEEVKSDDIVSYLIEQAAKLKASDIHLEVGERRVRVRVRIDGVLHPVGYVSPEKYRLIMSSVAAKANISMSSPDAQTGHMETRIGESDSELLNMRIETVPTLYGQDAVIRLFTINENLLNLAKLGLDQSQQKSVEAVVAHPSGLVLAVGPTGSGKTTTLYAIIKALNKPDRKIITLEDPIEYSVDGIVQIPVSSAKEESFANKLRAVLRLDPDILMVGEIRDIDTAKTALQAALSGHLVLSTFHANDSAAAISRLVDLVGENPLLASAIRLVIAQRLVRRLDDKTKQPYQPDEQLKAKIREGLADVPAAIIGQDLSDFELYHPGASKDVPFGFSGQTAVVETLEVSEQLADRMQDPSQLTIQHVQEIIANEGMITMYQHALIKALHGETTIEEVFRVVA